MRWPRVYALGRSVSPFIVALASTCGIAEERALERKLCRMQWIPEWGALG